jgi:hypothetical protein
LSVFKNYSLTLNYKTMIKTTKLLFRICLFICVSAGFVSCEDGIDGRDGLDGVNGMDGQDGQNGQDGEDGNSTVGSYNYSNLRPLATVAPGFDNVKVSALISSTDVIPTSSGDDFQIGGSADGAGAIVNAEGNIALISNFEDHYAIGRIILDPETLEPLEGDYMLNSSVSDYARECSGTMWEAAIHGGSQNMFISGAETWHNVNKGIDPEAAPNPSEPTRRFPAMGQFGFENAVPLPQAAYPGATVIIGGDDDYGFYGDGGGSVTMYLSEGGDADWDGGEAYVLRLAENEGQIDGEPADESDISFGQSYAVEFVKVTDNPESLNNAVDWDNASKAVNAFEFVRVEDIDYGKGNAAANRIVYISVTGRGPDRGTPNDWGTGYKLELNADNPLEGTLTQIISGNTGDINNGDGNMPLLQSPDNICVTENYIYWQEDPNSFSRGHQAFIWQTDLNGNNPTPVLQIDYDPLLDAIGDNALDSDGFNGEFGALFDITDKVSNPSASSVFILNLQPHYWTNPNYAGIDGHDNGFGQPSGFAPREDLQGSQIVVLEGLPR